MSSDDDKTVFNPGTDAFQTDPNATILIPNPGRRLRPESVAPSGGTQGPEPPTPPARQPLSPLRVRVRGQDNAILSVSSTLITVLSALTNSLSHPNIAQLQQELATEIGNLDARLKQAGVRSEEALTARYVICSAIDEAVMNTPWGVESGWGQRSLLRVYHNEASGGERFFVLLDQLMAQPHQYRDLLELFYVLLCMGFKGKYHLDPAGDSRIDTLRERLHQELYGGRPYERALSNVAQLGAIARPGLRHQIPLWVVLSVALALTLLVYTGLRAWMYSGSVDISRSFDSIYPVDQRER
jgi:type VI secretion system protein ImpK